MKRFILTRNILQFREILHDGDLPLSERQHFGRLLADAQRELALLDASATGALSSPRWSETAKQEERIFEAEMRKVDAPCLIIDPRPGLHIIEVNGAYEIATMTQGGRISGQRLFDIFPDNPTDMTASGVANLFASLKIAGDSREPHAMAIQRYDIRDDHGTFVERYWQTRNIPLFRQNGELAFLLHNAIDVTGVVMSARTSAPSYPDDSLR
ncbi:hypothetical protein [Sphingomonas sp. MMS24-J13]|uniref:hypothetical protein n=1 Tax=Sphingomonas sp. MMS24-J13 TaxID=3238686 RepID=UPI0038502144